MVLVVGSIMGPLILIGEQNFEKMKRNANAKIDIYYVPFSFSNIHTFPSKKLFWPNLADLSFFSFFNQFPTKQGASDVPRP